jgi:hypothetical protein
MPVESAADRAVFVNAAEHGVVATWTVAATSAVRAVSGIFDAPSADEVTGDDFGSAYEGMAVTAQRISFLVASADIPASARDGDALVIEGVAYILRDVRPDGTGFTELRLEADT